MRRHRSLTIAAGAALVLMVWASPASAHATFAGASAYPSDTDQQLTLDVPEERGPDIHNTGVSVFIPAGWSPLACPAKTSWSCQVIPPAGNQPAEVRWTKDAGAPPGEDETFVFTVHTGPPGKATFPVIQTYSSGEKARWIDDPDGEAPAPVLEALAPGVTSTSGAPTTTTTHAIPSTAAPTTRSTGSPTTTAAPITSTTQAVPVTGEETITTETGGEPTSTTAEASPADGDDGGGSSPLGVIALIVALAALAGGGAWFVRKRR